MKLLDRAAILGADDLKTEDVEVKEWGGAVRVRMLTGAERDAFGKSLIVDGKPDPTGYRAKLLARCVIGEDGKPLFTEADIGALNGKANQALERVFAVADRLNAINTAAVETAENNS
jgi:hypothetical protein